MGSRRKISRADLATLFLCVFVSLSLGFGCTAITGAKDLQKVDDCVGDCADSAADVADVADVVDVVDVVDTGSACSAAPLTSWAAPVKLDKVAAPGGGTPGAVDPAVSPDGLQLFFTTTDPGHRAFVVTRALRSDTFAGGALLEGLDSVTGSINQPTPGSGLREVLFAVEGDLWVGTRGTTSGPVKPIKYPPGDLNTADDEGYPTMSAGSELRLIFARTKAGGHTRLYEATRSDPSPGGGFGSVTDLAALNSADYDVTCPALSPDGLVLFFATTEGFDPGDSGATPQTKVFVTQRAKLDAPFGAPVAVPALTAAGKLNCPRSITDDRCEIFLGSDRDGKLTGYVAKRGK
jgi:hypothetical protein